MIEKLELKAFDSIGKLLIIVDLVLKVLLSVEQVEYGALNLLFDLVYELFVQSDEDLFHLILRRA